MGHLPHLILGTHSTPRPTSWLFLCVCVTLTALLSNQLWSCISNLSSVEIALHLKSWALSVLCLFEIWAMLTTLLLYSLNPPCALPRMSFSYLIFLSVPGVKDPAGSVTLRNPSDAHKPQSSVSNCCLAETWRLPSNSKIFINFISRKSFWGQHAESSYRFFIEL